MPNNTIPDSKKAAIVIMSQLYGDRAIANRLDIGRQTVKKYREEYSRDEELQMENGVLTHA